MKNLLLILVMLITGLTSAQDTPCNPETQDNCPTVFNFDECGSTLTHSFTGFKATAFEASKFGNIDYFSENVIEDILTPLLSIFLSDASMNDVCLEDAYGMNINFYPFTSADPTLSNSAVAGYASLSEDNTINLNINETIWDGEFYEGFEIRKIGLIYHELGHAVLGLGHNCTTGDIMHPGTQQGCGTPVSDNTTQGAPNYWSNFPTNNLEKFEANVLIMFARAEAKLCTVD